MRIRTLILALLRTIGAAGSLDAQYIRIGNVEAIPNGVVGPPTIWNPPCVLQRLDLAMVSIRRQPYRFRNGSSPATRNGAPVEVVAQTDVEFNLRTANTYAWQREWLYRP